jgi:hypothetical protein
MIARPPSVSASPRRGWRPLGVCRVRPSLFLAFLLLLTAPVAAAKPAPHLANVKRLYELLYFSEAMTACQAAMQAGGLSRADLLETLKYQGLIAASTGKESAAADSFRRMLTIDPEAQLGKGHAPRIRRAFDSARRWLKKHGPIRLELNAPPAVYRARSTVLPAPTITDPLGMVNRVILYVRPVGAFTYTEIPPAPSTPGWRLDADQLEALRRAPALDYFLVAVDTAGSQVAALHTRVDPGRVTLLGPPLPGPPVPRLVSKRKRTPPTPLVKRWWFWTAIGAGVALAAGLSIGLTVHGAPTTVNAPITLQSGP